MMMVTIRQILVAIAVAVVVVVAVPFVDAFQIERTPTTNGVVDWMTYAREHDLFKKQHQQDVDNHKIRHPTSSVDQHGHTIMTKMYLLTDKDRTWRFPKPSDVMHVDRPADEGNDQHHHHSDPLPLPHDLTAEDRTFQLVRSPSSFRRHDDDDDGHVDNEPYSDQDRMWRSRPSQDVVRRHDLDFPTHMSDDDRAFWWKNKEHETYGHLLLEKDDDKDDMKMKDNVDDIDVRKRNRPSHDVVLQHDLDFPAHMNDEDMNTKDNMEDINIQKLD